MYSVVYQILNIITPLITAPYISRVLGVSNMGIYSYTKSISSYFLLIAMLGISNYGNRAIATSRDNKNKTSRLFWEIYSIQFVSSILTTIAYLIYINFFAVNQLVSFTWMFYVLSAFFDISWFYFGIEEFRLVVTRNVILKITSVILIFTLINSYEDIWKYSLIMSLSTLINQLILWLFIKNYIKFYRINIKTVKEHLKPILVLFIPVIAVSVYTIMDKIMIGQLSTMTEAGLYENAQKIMTLPTGIITALGTVMMPRMANLLSKNELYKAKQYLEISMKFTMIMSSAIAFGIAGIAPVFAPVFFGIEFMGSSKIMSLLAVTVVIISWANVIRTQYLIPNHKDKVYVNAVILGAIINIIVNILLIPKYGAIGASIATILAELAVAIYQTLTIYYEIEIKKYIFSATPYMLFGMIMFGLVRIIGVYFGTSVATLIIQIIIGFLVYTIISLIYINKTDKNMRNILMSDNKS